MLRDDDVAPLPAVHLPSHPTTSTAAPRSRAAQTRGRRLSRLLDLVVASLALGLLSPLMGVIAVCIRCTSRGPALFKQVRLGQNRKPFVMLKFRSMYADCDDEPHRQYVSSLLTAPADSAESAADRAGLDREGLYKLAGDSRITPLGRWLRTLSLDELPQLLNVLRGEMAIVGPRPVLPWEAELIHPRHSTRFQVRPGITGLWQTKGRNRLTMIEGLDLDVQYAQQASLRLDLEILLRTVPVVLRREGAR